MEGRETLFFFDVPGTRRPCTSKHQKVPFFERERSVFVLLASKKNACGHALTLNQRRKLGFFVFFLSYHTPPPFADYAKHSTTSYLQIKPLYPPTCKSPTKPPTNHEMKIGPVPVVRLAQRPYKKGTQQSGGHAGCWRFFMDVPGGAARLREYNFCFFERPRLRRRCRSSSYFHEKLPNTVVTA